MRNDPEGTKVIASIKAIDAKLTKRDADLRDADVRCNAKRAEDKIEWQEKLNNAVDQMTKAQQNALNQLHTEFISRMEAQEASHAEELGNFGVNAAMISFRQIAVEIRNYYACDVGGVTMKPNKQPNSNELKIFLGKVGSDTKRQDPGMAAKLAEKIKEDEHPWTWDNICIFYLFANEYAHPSINTATD